MRTMRCSLGPFLGLVLLLASRAFAHTGGGEQAGFGTGFLHPLSGWDHMVAMVAVGLWGAQLGAPAVWALPVTFPMVMALGGMLGLLGIPLPGIEIGIALSAVVLGTMIVTAARPPLWVAGLIVAVFAVFHGYAHGAELPAGGNALFYSLGFVIATGLLHALGITIGVIHRWSAGRIALRVLGGGVAAAGVVFLVQAL